MMICDNGTDATTKREKVFDDHDAIRLIGSCRVRAGSIDDEVIEKGAQILIEDRSVTIEAFVLLVMHLDPDSKHAPLYHRYAHAHFRDPAELNVLATLARVGTPIRLIAGSARLRAEVDAVRNARRVIPDLSLQSQIPLPGEPEERLLAILDKLEEIIR